MARLIIVFLVLLTFKSFSQNLETIFEQSKGIESANYEQTISYYTLLAETYPEISIMEKGMTDSGHPLHIVVYNSDREFDFTKITKTKILINNGIHPGEPDGIDASMILLRDIIKNKNWHEKLNNTVICIIPIYNVGGSLNRNSTSRVNQNGPMNYGFRGNSRNFDLNRDFIKNDTKNAQTFTRIFHEIDPDVFIDNHVSNGADYQYTLTHLFTQHNKMGSDLGKFIEQKMKPMIEKDLESKGVIVTPYVNVFNQKPEFGFSQFMDSPRYSTGYTTLFNSLGMMVETHMLKSYEQRVQATYEFMSSVLKFMHENGKEIKELRADFLNKMLQNKKYALHWKVDSSKASTLQFKGFEAEFIESSITNHPRLKFDREKPFTKSVAYYNNFIPSKEIVIPEAYVIPSGWWKIVHLLKENNIEFHTINKDTILTVQSYIIESYKTVDKPFEGHYMHHDVEISKTNKKISFKRGDFYVPTRQLGIKYILETLEPEALDSFFNWNFFDTILQRKEGFSPYVFEELAAEILADNKDLKKQFEKKKKENIDFSKNWYLQLHYIYSNSKYAEKEYMQYPIYRVLKN